MLGSSALKVGPKRLPFVAELLEVPAQHAAWRFGRAPTGRPSASSRREFPGRPWRARSSGSWGSSVADFLGQTGIIE